MLTSKKALLGSWGVSLLLVVALVVTLQLTYEPAPETVDDGPTEEAEGVIESEGDTPAMAADLSLSQPLYFEELVEKTPFGDLPVIAPSGRLPWQAYSSPKVAADDTRKRIAIVISGLGLRSRMTERAFDALPPEVTFAFSPYGSNLDSWAERARQEGHEILMSLPMESINLQQENPGDMALLADRSPRENLVRMKEVMGRMHGYVGIIPLMGSRFTATTEDIQGPILDELKFRGLLFVDNRTNVYSRAVQFARKRSIPTAYVNRHIDKELVASQLNAELLELEARARQLGAAVGEIKALPISIKAVVDWSQKLDTQEFILVPISGVLEQQPTPRR